ncbi:MAG: hypothetical protein Q4A65_08240 [Bacillota bacterium]|nr:hypothetical protein [Bacillota bacterium]
MESTTDNRQIRRDRNTLMIVGAGVIIFCLWSILKDIGLILIHPTALIGPDLSVIPIITATVVLSIDIVIRLYVGTSAIREGRGEKQSRKYIRLTYLLILGSLVALIVYALMPVMLVEGVISLSDVDATPLASVIVEFTSLIMMVQLVRAAKRIKRCG